MGSQDVTQVITQKPPIDRLGYERVCTCLIRAVDTEDVLASGHDHDREITQRRVRTDLANHFEAVRSRHVEIDENDIEIAAFKLA